MPEHYNYPWHLLMESAAYDDLPVELEWVKTPGGTGEIASSLASGELDIATGLTEGIIAAIAAGNPSRILRTLVTTPLQWGIHVPAHSDLHELADLAGRRIAISRLGSGSHMMARVMADDLGFITDEDDFVSVGNLTGARRALAEGDAEIFLWDRSSTSPYVANGEFRRIGLQPTPWSSFVITAGVDVIEEQRDELNQILDGVAACAKAFSAEPNRVAIVAERYGLAISEVTTWFEETEWDCQGPTDLDMIANTQERLVSLGLIEEPRDPSYYLA